MSSVSFDFMSSLHTLSAALIRVFGHSLWQGVLIALAVWSLLRILPARYSRLRYGISLGGLGTLLLSLSVTWSIVRLANAPAISEPPPSRVAVDAPDAESTHSIAVSGGIDHSEAKRRSDSRSARSHQSETVSSNTANHRTDADSGTVNWPEWLMLVWLCGAAVMLTRGLRGLMTVRHWAVPAANNDADEVRHLSVLIQELARRMGLKRLVRVVVCEHVRIPAVLGLVWPVILIPPSLLSRIPIEQWQIILAHELAHVRRYDALINLAQMLVEALLFFNPAMWWLSRQIRIEREACCDALAAKVCGQPMSVARTLVDVAASLNDDERWTTHSDRLENDEHSPASLLAFVEPDSELKDRVQRLVVPDAAARPRVSALALTFAVAALVVTGLLLQKGSNFAVKTAAEMMSAKERVNRLVQMSAETGVIVPAAIAPASDGMASTKSPGTDQSEVHETVRLTIVVRTDDGQPVPKGLQLVSSSRSGNSSTSRSLNTPNEPVAEWVTHTSVPPGRAIVGAYAADYGVTTSEVMTLDGTRPEERVEVILSKGRAVTMKLAGEAGEVIPGARIRMSARVGVDGSWSGINIQTVTAGDDGLLRLEHIGSGPYELEVRAPGWQRAAQTITFSFDKPVVWTLKRAEPVVVRVVDAVSGNPVPDARFALAGISHSQNNRGFGDPRESWRTSDDWLIFAKTDATGRAVLDTLADQAVFHFGVAADGYALTLMEVRSGDADNTVKLHRPITLSGRVTGAIDRLHEQTQNGKTARVLSCDMSLIPSHWAGQYIPLDEQGRFEISGLAYGESVAFDLPDQERQRFTATESRSDLEFKIAAQKDKAPVIERDVIVQLTGTAPDAPARGSLKASWASEYRYIGNPLPFRQNEARFKVPQGMTINLEPGSDLVGYVFDEQKSVLVPAGDGPFVIQIPVRPAGGVQTTVLRADGNPAGSAFVTVFASKLPPGVKNHHDINPSVQSGLSTHLTRLPLGGTYRVIVREMTSEENVWVVSPEFTLDESHPIESLTLQLPTGKDVRMSVTDPDGKPVVNQEVQLSLNFSQQGGHSFGTGIIRTTDRAGQVVFPNLSYEASTEPLDVRYFVTVEPSRFMGLSQEVQPSERIVELKLKKGLSASGVVIDSESGKPVPNAEVRAHPSDYSKATYKGPTRTRTNSRGEFHFEGLEAQKYNGYVDGSVPRGTRIIKPPEGGTRFEYPNGVQQHSLVAGATEPVRWEIIIYEGSSLRTAD